MARSAWVAALLGVGLSVGGCIVGDPSPEPADVTVVDRTALAEVAPGERLFLDLRDVTAVYVFDPADGFIDLSRVWLICPDGTHMGLRQWLTQREAELGQDPRGDSLWALGLDPLATEQAIADRSGRCQSGCNYCPDGAWMCNMRCGSRSGPTGETSRWMYEFTRRSSGDESQPFLDGPWPRPDEGPGAYAGGSPGSGGSGSDGSGSGSRSSGWGHAGQPGD